MIRLHQTFGAHTGRTLTFEAGTVRCGRQPENEVPFDPNADLDASGFHAEIVREGGVWRLRDSKSRNGTWLNNSRVIEATLADGDEIEFGAGGPRLRVELVEADAPTMRPPGVQASIRPPPLGDRAVLFVPPPSASPVPAAPPAPDAGSTRAPATTPAVVDRTSKRPAAPVPATVPPEGKRRVGVFIAALMGCVGLLTVGLAAGVGLWWWKRVRTPPPTAADASRIATAHAGALFSVLHRDPSGREHEICAGFAVRRDLIATSAQCVHALQAAAESGHHALARPPGGVAQDVTQMYRHPEMPPGAQVGPDVGLLRVSGSAPALTSLAPSPDVQHLADGTAIFVWAAAESGGGLRGGRVTHVADLPGAAAGGGRQLLHVLVGTPGSPVFDREGRVIGVHAGTVGQGAVPGYGVRIDVLHGLLAGL